MAGSAVGLFIPLSSQPGVPCCDVTMMTTSLAPSQSSKTTVVYVVCHEVTCLYIIDMKYLLDRAPRQTWIGLSGSSEEAVDGFCDGSVAL